MRPPPSTTCTEIRSFTGLVGHYRHFIKGFANIAASLYDLVSGENKDKKSEAVTLTAEALTAFETLKEKCVQAPILAFPDFQKPFLLETNASGGWCPSLFHTVRGMSDVLALSWPPILVSMLSVARLNIHSVHCSPMAGALSW